MESTSNSVEVSSNLNTDNLRTDFDAFEVMIVGAMINY